MLHMFTLFRKSLMNTRNYKGPKNGPCGTPRTKCGYSDNQLH